MQTANSVLEAIDMAKSGGDCMTRCPSHDDGQASLHVSPGRDGNVVLMCHAQCPTESVLQAAGLGWDAIMGERDETDHRGDNDAARWTPAGPYSHAYPYVDEHGNLLFEVLRIPLPGGRKTFRQRQPDTTQPRGWKWSLEGVRRVLYRLPEVLRAKDEGRVIWIVEGEKDVETLRRHGLTATTSPMGAGKWLPEFTEVLAGSTVTIIPDADATGRAHARQVADWLRAAGCSVSMREPVAPSKDVTAHYEAGGTVDTLLETAPEGGNERESYGIDVLDAVKRVFSPASFIIPNVLAKGDRMIITGFEGTGKSELLREIAVLVAAGINPMKTEDMEPQRVLYVDSENHPDQVLESWQNLLKLCDDRGRPVGPGMLTILEEWDNEISLANEDGRAWLIERIHAYRPHLVCMGPLYNMSHRDLKEDDTVRKIKSAVNEARSLYGTAFIMEHHAPHKGPGDKERSVRPYGSSTFLKWPEFGYGLRPVPEEETPAFEGLYEFQRTRWPRVRSRYFPPFFRWGNPEAGEFPWMPVTQEDIDFELSRKGLL